MITATQVIGWAALPLNGVYRIDGNSAEGQIKTGLSVTVKEKEEVYQGKFEDVVRSLLAARYWLTIGSL